MNEIAARSIPLSMYVFVGIVRLRTANAISSSVFEAPTPAFLAYPSGGHWRDQMGQLASELTGRGFRAQTWEMIGAPGLGNMFRRICKAIHANDIFIAEVSETNLNVLFEVGYAIGIGRDPILLKDPNRTSTADPPILPTYYQCRYERLEQIWPRVNQYSREREDSFEPNRTSSMLRPVNLAGEREGVVYLVPAWNEQASRSVIDTLEKVKKNGTIVEFLVADPTDSLFDGFLTHARLVAEAEYIVGLMVSDDFRESLTHNAPVALLLGVAAGLGKDVLLLREGPSKPILDLGTVLRTFIGPSQAAAIFQTWISERAVVGTESQRDTGSATTRTGGGHGMKLPDREAIRTHKRARRAKVKFFGPPDATLDSDLMQYFIETPSFESALSGAKELLIGRKGVGKSSILTALEAELGTSHDSLFVKITPLELEYEQLAVALERIGPVVHPNFLYPSFWRFIILTEIVRALKDHARWWDLPGLDARELSIIQQVAVELDRPITADFSLRIMQTLQDIGVTAESATPDRVQAEVEKSLSKARLYPLEDVLVKLSAQLPIFVAIDDIDKRWNPGFDPSVIWLKGLFDEMARLRRKLKAGLLSVILLREDMFAHVRAHDADFANRSTSLLRWGRSQLEEVIRARLEFLVDQEYNSANEAWNAIFPETTSGIKTSDYLIDRTLMRPRDLIQYCQLALERAQRAGRQEIIEADVLDAESEFSRYLFDSIRTEALLTHPALEMAMLPFLGAAMRGSSFSEELHEGLAGLKEAGAQWANTEKDIVEALFDLGFIGLMRKEQPQVYYSWMRSYDDANRLTKNNQELCIHPGFHNYLEIQEVS